MALIAKHKEVVFGVGDGVRVHLKIKEGEKTRNQFFDGIVIGVKGSDTGKSFTVRKIGANGVGVEMIFPLNTPNLESVEVTRKGTEGVQHAKLYYIRNKSPREIEKIYSRAAHKNPATSAGRQKQVAKKKKKIVKKATGRKKVASKGK